jgi:hypothetical protein
MEAWIVVPERSKIVKYVFGLIASRLYSAHMMSSAAAICSTLREVSCLLVLVISRPR